MTNEPKYIKMRNLKSEEGYTKINAPALWVKNVMPLYESMDIASLYGTKHNILEAAKDYRSRYGETQKDLDNLRRRINRLIAEREKEKGSVPVPNTVIRNSIMSKSMIDSLLASGDLKIEGDPELTKKSGLVLSGGTAGYIMDAVGHYVNTYYRQGENPTMKLDTEGKYYIIADTFDEFCKKGCIQGNDRRAVKEGLFPSDGRSGLLENISFIIPTVGNKKLSINVRFVSARLTLKQQAEQVRNLNRGDVAKQETSETVLAFEMDIHAGIYDFLSYREDLIAGKKVQGLKDGFQWTPKNLHAKVERTLEGMRYVNTIEKDAFYIKGSNDRYVQGFVYCLNKWNTGSELRQKNMIVTWQELYEKLDSFPRNTKRKERRQKELETIMALLNTSINTDMIMKGCDRVEVQNNPLQLCFYLKTK